MLWQIAIRHCWCHLLRPFPCAVCSCAADLQHHHDAAPSCMGGAYVHMQVCIQRSVKFSERQGDEASAAAVYLVLWLCWNICHD